MNNLDNIVKLIKKKRIGKVLLDQSMKNYTTYHVGGIAKVVVIPKDVMKLIELMTIIYDNKLKYKVIGNGSNLIFSEKEYDGIIIKLDNLNKMEIKENIVTVGAGYNLMKLSREVAKKSLTGLEFAGGIPGTIGGAIYMNAGAYKSDMGYIVKRVKVLTPDLKVISLDNQELDFHYRSSFFQKHKNYICLEATLKLKKGKKELILEIMEDRRKRRIESQPLNYPSAGSVFRNPEDSFAGKLIEDLGLKGKKIGGAEVSTKHANFIINTGKATSDDIKNLIEEIQRKVKEEYNINLKVEQEFVNWEK